MKVRDFIEQLQVFGEDTEVYITTTPDDLCQPIQLKLMSLIPARHDERYGLQPAKLLLTAYIPYKDK